MTGSHVDSQHHDALFPDALRRDAPAPRTLRPRAGRVLVAATSLAVGAVAAGGTAMAIGHGPQDLSVSNAAARSPLDKGAPDGDANAPGAARRLGDGAGDDGHGEDVSRTPRPERPKPRADRCIALDATVLAAIAAARRNGSAGSVTADTKAVYVPVKAVTVVSCTAVARTPKPTTTSGRATPTVTTTTAAPRTTTRTTAAPRTTTRTTAAPRTTTTKPAPRTTTTTAAS